MAMKSIFRGIPAALAALIISTGGAPEARAGGAAAATGGQRQFLSIAPLEAKRLIETRKDLLLIDVRSPEEFAQGALPGSRLIPFWDVMKGRHDLPKDKPILLVCAVGGRSLAVGKYLQVQGYPELYNLKGGLEAWVRDRVPLPQRRANSGLAPSH